MVIFKITLDPQIGSDPFFFPYARERKSEKEPQARENCGDRCHFLFPFIISESSPLFRCSPENYKDKQVVSGNDVTAAIKIVQFFQIFPLHTYKIKMPKFPHNTL